MRDIELFLDQIVAKEAIVAERRAEINAHVQQQSMETTSQIQRHAQIAIGATLDSFAQVGNLISEVAVMTARTSRDAAKKRMDAQIAEATGMAIMASLNQMATGTFPYNLITAGVTLATGLAQVGILATERSRLHSGGMLAPDELSFGNTIVRHNEIPAAIITEQGRERQTVQDINAGTPNRQAPQNVYLVLDRRMTRARHAGSYRGRILGHRGT